MKLTNLSDFEMDKEDARDLIIAELQCRVNSMEKSIKDTNRQIKAIRNQLRKEKGREELED